MRLPLVQPHGMHGFGQGRATLRPPPRANGIADAIKPEIFGPLHHIVRQIRQRQAGDES